jgi:hypothetical protein
VTLAARALALASCAAFTAVAVAACGSRSELEIGPALPPCSVVSDCPGFGDRCQTLACKANGDANAGPPTLDAPGECVVLSKVDCDDHDPCTNDVCDPSTGACAHPHVTPDADGDGSYAPLPGHVAGDPGSCGTDCDDANASVHPGAIEVCDGVDNDCNGVVDDGALFVQSDPAVVRISGDIAPASPGGLAFGGGNYAAVYWGSTGGDFQIFSQLLTPSGASVPPGETPLVLNANGASGGPVVWAGDRFGVAWSDPRSGSYDIFFAGLQPNGAKIAPGDVQLSAASGYSVNPSLAWTGTEFVVAWQDDRSGAFAVLAQRLDGAGTPIGGNVALTGASTGSGFADESPEIASGLSTLGFAWSHEPTGAPPIVSFQAIPRDLTAATAPVVALTDGTTHAVYPTITWSTDRYVVAWYDETAQPAAIYAAAVDEQGHILAPARAISSPGNAHSRFPSMLPLGDRVLFVYADDRVGDGYELYTRTVTTDLDPLTDEVRLTHASGDSLSPVAAFGPNGDVGILFLDQRNGEHDLYFTRLTCAASGSP